MNDDEWWWMMLMIGDGKEWLQTPLNDLFHFSIHKPVFALRFRALVGDKKIACRSSGHEDANRCKHRTGAWKSSMHHRWPRWKCTSVTWQRRKPSEKVATLSKNKHVPLIDYYYELFSDMQIEQHDAMYVLTSCKANRLIDQILQNARDHDLDVSEPVGVMSFVTTHVTLKAMQLPWHHVNGLIKTADLTAMKHDSNAIFF